MEFQLRTAERENGEALIPTVKGSFAVHPHVTMDNGCGTLALCVESPDFEECAVIHLTVDEAHDLAIKLINAARTATII